MAANKIKLEAKGFRDARKAFKFLVATLDPAASKGQIAGLYRLARNGIETALRDSGKTVRDKARSNAAVTRSPRRLHTGAKPAIFSFADFSASSSAKRKRAVLVGVRTGLAAKAEDERLFINWGKGAKRRGDGTVAKEGLSMSFGTLYERGTKDGRVRARAFFKQATITTKNTITRIVGQAYVRAVELMNQNTK